MRHVLILWLLSQAASAETWSANSGLSVGPNGVSVTAPPTGNNPELTYQNGSVNLNFSVFGNAQPAPASTGPVRVISPAASTTSVLSDSNEFFRGVGKPAGSEDTAPRRSRE